MDLDDDDGFDDRDLMELVSLAAYLENKASRGLFPKARFRRYSDALTRLVIFMVEELTSSEHRAIVEEIIRRRSGQSSPHGDAKVLTHPRFSGRRKPHDK